MEEDYKDDKDTDKDGDRMGDNDRMGIGWEKVIHIRMNI